MSPRARQAVARQAAAGRARFGPPLPPAFYDRDTEQVARDLLGCIVAHASPEGLVAGRIVETEAYLGPHDPACHAVAGRTKRTHWLFGPPGTAYIYRIYGLYWCLNAVTREEGHGSAVLIRAVEPVEGVAVMRDRRPVPRDRDLTSGPGKLCRAFGLTGAQDGLPLYEGVLTMHPGAPVPDDHVAIGPRIGLTKAVDWPLRFHETGNHFVSRTPPGRPGRKRAPR